MNGLTNGFSVLSLDAEDDKEQLTVLSTAISVNDGPESGSVNGKSSGEGTSSSTEEYKDALVWVDLEMTGLDVEVDRILEIACIITNGKLTKSTEGPDLVIHQEKKCLDKMNDWCQEHHGKSGLKEAVLQSPITEEDAEEQVMEFVKKHVCLNLRKPHLAGNSVYTDLLFLKKYMPRLASMFHHILVDVSTVKILRILWYPKGRAPKKENAHRAMDDIRESIKELQYYKDNIFRSSNKKAKY